MEHISISTIRNFIEIHAVFVYIIILLGVIVEGEIVVIFAGIFSYLGSINIYLAFFSVVLAGVIKSIIGYSIGYYLSKKHSHKIFMKKIESRVSYFLPKFKDRPFWSIFISRFFILGIGIFTLIFSGYKRVSLKTYIKAETSSLLLWSIGFISLGYFFGYTALSISKDIRHILLIILLFFITFFVLERVLAFIVELFSIKEFNELE